MTPAKWISVKDQPAPRGKDIMILWICEEDGAVGETKCERLPDGRYLVGPGKFLQFNEVVKYWFPMPELPPDIQEFMNYHWGTENPEDPPTPF